RVGRDDVGQHFVGAPLLGLRPLGKPCGRHRACRSRQVRHSGFHFRDDFPRRLFGTLGLEIVADALLLVGHGEIVCLTFAKITRPALTVRRAGAAGPDLAAPTVSSCSGGPTDRSCLKFRRRRKCPWRRAKHCARGTTRTGFTSTRGLHCPAGSASGSTSDTRSMCYTLWRQAAKRKLCGGCRGPM